LTALTALTAFAAGAATFSTTGVGAGASVFLLVRTILYYT